MADYFLSIAGSLKALGARARDLRLLGNLTQQELATNAGVGLKALRRFESTGKGTIENVVRVAVALGAQDAFAGLFAPPPFTSLAEAEAEARSVTVTRRRARRPR